MATERIDIRIAENGSRTVKRSLEDVGRAGEAAARGVGLLQEALAGLAVGAGLLYLQRQADAYTTILNRLRLVTSGTQNLARVNDELYASANRPYASYEATAELYGSLARASQTLGLSQRDLLGITETINQAIAISGTEASTAANGLRQLGQGLASGTLRGDELNSVLENMPRLAKAIADGMGVSVGQLRNLGAQGKITGQQITEALKKAAPQVAEEFARVNQTIANSFQVLQNHLTRLIGKLNESSGVGAAFGRTVIFLADHLEGLAILAAGVGAAFAWSRASAFVVAMIGPLVQLEKALGAASTAQALFAVATKYTAGAFRTLTAAMLSNPFTALLVVLTVAVAAIVEFGDKVSVTADGAVSLKDAFFAALSLIGDLVRTVAGAFMAAWDGTVSAVQELLAGFGTSFGEVMAWVGGIAKAVGNAIIGYYVAAFNVIKVAWNNFPGFMDLLFTSVVNMAIAAAELVINAWQAPFRGLAAIASFVDQDFANAINGSLDRMTIELPRAKLSAAGQQAGGDIMAGVRSAFSTDYLGNAWDAVIARARGMKDGGGSDLAGGGPASPQAQGAGKKGKDEETRAEYLAKLAADTRAATDAARSMNFEYSRADEEVLKINSHLRDRKWAELTAGETAAIREQLKALYDAEDMQERMKKAYDDFKRPQEDYLKNSEAINRVVKQFPQYAEQGAQALRALRMEYLATKNDVGSGIELGRLGVQKSQQEGGASRVGGLYQDEYGQANNAMRDMQERMVVLRQLMRDDPINSGQYRQRMMELGLQALQLKAQMPGADTFDALRAGFASFVADFKGVVPSLSAAWGQFFTQFADGVANSIGRAIVYGENLGASLKSVAQEALAGLISALVKMGIQWLVMQVIGQTAMASITATGAVAGAATAAAWAPAAAAVSLATFGANAGPAAAGIALTYGLTSALSVLGGIAGLADGGLRTGPGGPRQDNLLTWLSNGEFVVNAASTRQYLPLLEAINSGRRLPGYADGGVVGSTPGLSVAAVPVQQPGRSDAGSVKVTIEDHVGAKFEVQQVSADEVRVIARQEAQDQIRRMTPDLVAADLANPNGKTSKALSRTTTLGRRRS